MSWILMVAFGGGLMWLMRWTDSDLIDALLRLSGAAFVGAGLIGAQGWLGQVVTSGTAWVMKTGDSLGSAAIGTSVVWIIAAALALMWIGSMLPTRVIGFDPPDWLIFAGFFLPSLEASVPGQLGGALRAITSWAGHGVNGLVSGLVS
jgi:hypothetical protein